MTTIGQLTLADIGKHIRIPARGCDGRLMSVEADDFDGWVRLKVTGGLGGTFCHHTVGIGWTAEVLS